MTNRHKTKRKQKSKAPFKDLPCMSLPRFPRRVLKNCPIRPFGGGLRPCHSGGRTDLMPVLIQHIRSYDDNRERESNLKQL